MVVGQRFDLVHQHIYQWGLVRPDEAAKPRSGSPTVIMVKAMEYRIPDHLPSLKFR